MDEYQLNDLKQFIADTVSQTEVKLTGRIDGLDGRLRRLEQKVDDGFAGVAEAIDQLNQRIDDRDKKVDQRFIKLEGGLPHSSLS